MKVEFQNSDLTPRNLSQKWKDFEKIMQADVAAYYAEQAQYNAPLLEGKDVIAESLSFSTSEDNSSLIEADHPAAYAMHEEMSKEYEHNPKEQKSQTGGIGSKYIERAVFNSAPIVKKHYVESMQAFFEGKPYKKLAKGYTGV